MSLPTLAKRVKKMASTQLFNLKLLLNGESSRGFSKFKKTYKLKGELGRGGFGIVYRAVRIVDDYSVAVKFIDRGNIKEWAWVEGEQVPMEIGMLLKCSDVSGVIKLLDWYSIPEGYLIVMERPYPCVDMFDFIKQQNKLDEEMARFLFRQIVETVQKCAQNKVLHRDLKDENVVIDLVTGATKLIDFGAATLLKKSHYSDFQGTRLYCPPEWFLHSLYLGKEAAVWSLGVLLYNSINGRLPFRNEKDICTAHLLGPLPFYVPASSEVKELIAKCLSFDPYERCTLEGILQHSWLKKQTTSWQTLTSKKVVPAKKEHSEELEEVECEEEKQNSVGSSESGVGSSASTSKTKCTPPSSRISKTSLIAAPDSTELKAAARASKTKTASQFATSLHRPRRVKPQNQIVQKQYIVYPNQPNSTVLTALRRAMSKERQKRVDVFIRA